MTKTTTSNVKLTRQSLGAVLPGCHRERTRYAMGGVQVHPSGTLLATDGRMLLAVHKTDGPSLASTLAETPIVVERKAATELLRATKKADSPYQLDTKAEPSTHNGNVYGYAERHGVGRSVELVGGMAPPAADVLKGALAHQAQEVGISATLLARLAKSAIAHGGKDAILRFRFVEDKPGSKPVVATSTVTQDNGTKTTLTGVVMPAILG